MSLTKKLKSFGRSMLIWSGVLVGSYVIPSASCNVMITYRNNYETKKGKVMHKMDGLLSSTEVTVNKVNSRINIAKHTPLFHKDVYYWGGCDGLVDMIAENNSLFTRRPWNESFDREDDYQDYPDKFKEADKYFKEQLERFGLCKNK